MHIVLVVPVSHTHYVVPPIGLGYLATALRAKGFHEITILDSLKEKLSHDGLHERIVKLKPDIVGFQVFSYDFESVRKSIALLKKSLPATVTLIGGPHVSATGTQSLQEMAGADYGFVGEAEPGLPLLMRNLEEAGGQAAYSDIPRLLWRDNGTIRVNPRQVVADIDAIGPPAWDLMPPNTYPDNPQGVFYRQRPIAPIATSRGCPYPCTFCGSGLNMGRKLRLRDIGSVIAEMKMLYDVYGVREFHLIDDMFNFHKSRVLEFCAELKRLDLGISYTFPNGL